MDSQPANTSILAPNVVDQAMPLHAAIDFNNIAEFDFEQATYLFEGTGYKVNQDHTEFIFKVTPPNGVAFQVCDRYSSIRSFYEVVKKYIGDEAKHLPKFPPKKMLGTKEVSFLIKRQKELVEFFNAFMNKPQIARHQFVLTYFSTRIS